ncbi:ATP-grasp domain-containing protein [Nocardia terpenica]|uniref:ATP-grasp domain-containing protein n=1 Tax=Nocardia terpenica TaxID=455432 RepID=UPI0018942B09|nr:ATP-grasp domain-containing protein [Nocardia terpenica]MBF6059258.1 ATP-grasp domain-containing protein [Nocardia terpenica]MBF6103203.1 ATP-grasp domain-containing protein [Nocardia terpenica]MBF6110608.1 ATP-grasp domain-containing protein [Nocardia terpenica]MBF6116739.1 ATP-grasp domain-containing protein [Nocardia terpenica]
MVPATVAPVRRILVTGVGGAPGFDMARRLMELGCEVIGTDADSLATGLRLPGLTSVVCPSVVDPIYSTVLLDLCRIHRPHAIMSTVESELPLLFSMLPALDDLLVRTWLPPRRALRAALDKAAFYAVLTEHRIPTPRTWLPEQTDDVPYRGPLVVKPRHGQGSKGVVFCGSRLHARVLVELIPEPIVQTRIEGAREFTADCLVDRHGHPSIILRYRQIIKGGLSMVSETFHDPRAHDAVAATLAATGITGLCCVQGFLCDSATSPVLMTEVNARAAGGFTVAEAAGADLIGQTLAGLWGLPVDHDRLHYRPGVRVTRYVETLAAELLAAQPFPEGVGHDPA